MSNFSLLQAEHDKAISRDLTGVLRAQERSRVGQQRHALSPVGQVFLEPEDGEVLTGKESGHSTISIALSLFALVGAGLGLVQILETANPPTVSAGGPDWQPGNWECVNGQVVHTVSTGDTVYDLAQAYNSTVPGILQANNITALNSNGAPLIHRGNKLLIPRVSCEDARARGLFPSDRVISGSNASIIVNRDGELIPISIRIPAQIPGQTLTKIQYLDNGQIITVLVPKSEIKLPTRPSVNWLATDAISLPKENPISRTIKEAEKGVMWINDYLLKSGAKTSLLTAEKMQINLVENPAAYDQTICYQKGVCIQDVPYRRYLTTVRGSDGGDLVLNGKTYWYVDYIDATHTATLLFRTLHERIHTGVRNNKYVENYYVGDSGNVPSAALERFSDALASLAIANVYRNSQNDPELDKALRVYGDKFDSSLSVKWLEKMLSSLESVGYKRGEILEMCVTGDMVGLQSLYDSKFGQGSFASTLR